MCWNQYVSLNTFVFGIFILLLIAYNNKYSQYKITEFQSVYTYFFFVSFISMQLIEFFLWRNLNNTFFNQFFSFIGSFLLFIQPIASLSMLQNQSLKWKLMTSYFIPASLYFIYDYNRHPYITTVSKTGHLKWKWIDFINHNVLYLFWLFFFFYSFVANKYYGGMIFGILLFTITYYSYYKDGSAGSLWCWIVNSIMIYYAFRLLFILPFITK